MFCLKKNINNPINPVYWLDNGLIKLVSQRLFKVFVSKRFTVAGEIR